MQGLKPCQNFALNLNSRGWDLNVAKILPGIEPTLWVLEPCQNSIWDSNHMARTQTLQKPSLRLEPQSLVTGCLDLLRLRFFDPSTEGIQSDKQEVDLLT